MAIIIDIKNAIRKAIYTKDNNINFFFDEILKVKYPYVFFYIPSYRVEKAVDTNYWRKLTLMCVVEYAKGENNSTSDLWSYADTLDEALSLFEYADTKIGVKNAEYKLVEGVLQMAFDLEVYVKLVDETDIMQELELGLK